MDFALNRSNKC